MTTNAQPIPKPAPARNDGQRSRAIGSILQGAVPIFLHEPILDEILEYSEQDMRRELGGFLLGGLHTDEKNYVEIRGFAPAVDTRSAAASLTFTHETWASLNRKIAEEYPDDIVVGWHHTHPGLGIFLSSHDMFIHRNFFPLKWQVAMVVDPQRQDFCFFQWLDDTVVDCGFICVPAKS